MRLTNFTDFSIRVLLYAAAFDDRLVTIAEMQERFGLSKGHLMKIVQLLSNEGYLEAVRGRSGGLRLGMPADKIIIGRLVRLTEPDFQLVECFGTGNKCILSKSCKLAEPLNKALSAFFATLDEYSLAEILLPKKHFEGPRPEKFPIRGPLKSIIGDRG